MSGGRGPKSASAAVWRSAILPGWGQAVLNRGTSAFTFLTLAGLLGVGFLWAGILALLDPIDFAAWAVQRQVMLGLIAANVAVGIFRLVAVGHAHWSGGGRPMSVALLMVVLFIVVPHAGLAWVQVRGYQSLTSVFQRAPEPPGVAASTTTPALTTAIPSSAPATVAPTTMAATTVPVPGRLTILLLGSDSGPHRSGVRTDTVMVASIDLVTGDLAIFGLPRNMSGLAFSDGLGVPGILNTAYGFGLQRPDRFPGIDPGASAVMEVAELITGLEIDNYVMVDMQSFVEVVNALGGVEMYVPVAVVDELYEIDQSGEPGISFSVGFHQFDGSDALAYVRTRRYSSDYSRMTRQRCVIAALGDQLDAASLLRGLPKLLSTLEENVATDIPFESLPDMIRMLDLVNMDDAITIGFTPPDWTAVGNVPDLAKIHAAVELTISDPAAAAHAFGLEGTVGGCGP